ncbi:MULTISPECIES: NlpC/P60 family protein [Rothia]|uniref:C40 family peptidase n=1 Tax=Rothia TaxID=32207 RepID=UPI00066A67B6|nr:MULTISPECIES: NlpC/P60 family protein [Rothia]MBF1675750.1 C40 family peptidase [Rothia sp. (in: high G+C Gram-positive bacteria)]OFM98745.1 hydrolase [Rothia sp. HMSC072B03]OFQ34127.1 hydrolase [Rothia sp. HMSC072E10]OFR67599.1 hydrolase [Rothia sp. HMSC068F09]
MAKKIVRTAGATLAAGAVLLGSTVPANAFAQIPAAADLSYDYTNYEFDYTSYTTPATTYVAPQAQAQQTYVAPAAAPAPAAETTYVAPQAETQQAYVAPVATQEQAAPAASSNTGNASRDAIVATAMSGLGGSYVWGGKSYGAWDCSGFTSWVFAQHGIKLTAFTYAMKNELRPTSNPQPGDIVFQNGYSHVGIYLGDGKMISALNPTNGTLVHPTSWMSVDGYYTAL